MKIKDNISELYNLFNEYLFLRETVIKECIRNELIENDDIDTSIVNEKSISVKCITENHLQTDNEILEIEKGLGEMKKIIRKYDNEEKIMGKKTLFKNGIIGYRDLLFNNKENLNAYEMNIDTINFWLKILK
jgi:hypothetical protein